MITAKAVSQMARLVVALLILVITVTTGQSAASAPLAARPLTPHSDPTPPSDPTTTSIFLPTVIRSRPQVVFGMEVLTLADSNLSLANAANPYWVRTAGFSWNLIEPALTAPRTYLWNIVDEKGLAQAAAKNLRVIGTIKKSPAWAQKYAGKICGPPSQNYLDEYAAFLEALVTRYSAPPYLVKYWELGNEVDVDYNLVPADSDYGCWGDPADKYYGGGYYAQMLVAAYPAIKRADPDAKVIIGGLLLDCDPTHPPAGKQCLPANFLEGILKNQGGNYFDILSFHIYPGYSQGTVIDENNLAWAARGGIVAGKISFLNEVMAKYGVSKPLMITEIAVGCNESSPECNPPPTIFYEAQADYVVSVYLRTWAAGILGATWYSLDDSGWRYTSLSTGSGPRQSYYAYQFMTTELLDTRLGSEITAYTGLKGYEFIRVDKRIWVLWSSDSQIHTITLPSGYTRVYDKYGNLITPQNSQIEVKSPVYIEKIP